MNHPNKQTMDELEKLYKSGQFNILKEKLLKLMNIYSSNSNLFNIFGIVLHKEEDFDGAIEAFNKAIKINPNFYFAHNNLGNSFKDQEKFEESISCYKSALKINPDYIDAYNNLGLALIKLGKINESTNFFEKALKINPNHVETYCNLGMALGELGLFDKALNNYNKAISLNPNYAEAYSNLGIILGNLGRFEEAISNHQKAIKLNPKYKTAIFNESTIRLKLGDFEKGWPMYEKRFHNKAIAVMRYRLDKMWDGKYLDGTLLVWGEQGVGDHIFFGSMVSGLKACSKNIILEIDNRLVNLFSNYFKKINFSNIRVQGLGKEEPKNYDKHIPIGSLGQFLRKNKRSFEKIPKNYLVSSLKKKQYFKNKFFSQKKFRIGLSWKTLNKKQQHRNINLEEMLPILDKNECEFINLQFGKFDNELSLIESKHGIKIRTIDEVDNYNDIENLASIIDNLDLVITIQNTVAHLSGALGVPTWIMLVKNARWHWLINEKKSLWYPSVTLFRQKIIGDWKSVINSISIDLEKLQQSLKNK